MKIVPLKGNIQKARSLPHVLALSQGIYFLSTGIWPILHSASFQKVTGPKADLWLVKTIGGLIGVIGGALIQVGLSSQPVPTSTIILGSASAASLGASDVVYSVKGCISPIYLLDALAEALLLGMWGMAIYRRWKR